MYQATAIMDGAELAYAESESKATARRECLDQLRGNQWIDATSVIISIRCPSGITIKEQASK